MLIAIILVAIYIVGGAITCGCLNKIDPYIDEADLTIGMLLWPLWLVCNLMAWIMSLFCYLGEWIAGLFWRS